MPPLVSDSVVAVDAAAAVVVLLAAVIVAVLASPAVSSPWPLAEAGHTGTHKHPPNTAGMDLYPCISSLPFHIGCTPVEPFEVAVRSSHCQPNVEK